MLKAVVATIGGHPVILMDTITKTMPEDAGAIVVSGSHGGSSSGEFAIAVPLTAVFFNDAGIGKDRAGVAALDMLEARGVPGLAVSHLSARIGEAADMWENGVVSVVNPAAARVGVTVGETVQAAARRFDRT